MWIVVETTEAGLSNSFGPFADQDEAMAWAESCVAINDSFMVLELTTPNTRG
jgi:hypothetical protein